MKVRSIGLATLGAGLLATAAALGAILVHDGEADGVRLAATVPGDHVAVKGEPQPFAPTPPLARWGAVLPVLGNHTYTVQQADGVTALLTSEHAMPAGVVLAEGTVAFVGPHPEGAGLLVVVEVRDWREPLLFR